MRHWNQLRVISTALVSMILLTSVAVFAAWIKGNRRDGTYWAIAANASRHGFRAELRIEPATIKAGEAVKLSFLIRNGKGAIVRFLQFVHERPLHLLIVSDDLQEFYHLHPEMQVDDSYGVHHSFPHGGTYRLYADYTPPGSATIVEQFELRVDGPTRPRVTVIPDEELTRAADGLRVNLSADAPVRAGEDVALKFALADEKTRAPVKDLQLYLGALAHFVIISDNLQDFIHAHPLDAGEVFDPSKDPTLHAHDPAQLAKRLVGPSPSEVTTYVNFPHAGVYKLWAQFQRRDRVIVMPFVLRVAEPKETPVTTAAVVLADATKINVSSSGYEPARVEAQRGQTIRLAFYRADVQNCAGTIVFPQLNIRRQLPVGETVVIEVTPTAAGEFTFTCGMGMYKGAVVVK